MLLKVRDTGFLIPICFIPVKYTGVDGIPIQPLFIITSQGEMYLSSFSFNYNCKVKAKELLHVGNPI